MNVLRNLLERGVFDLITGNSSEFLSVVGRTEIDDETLKLIGGLAPMIAMTMAEEGSVCFENGRYERIPPHENVRFPVYVVGAGDAYTSGVIQGLMNSKSFLESCLDGSRSAYQRCKEVYDNLTT